MRCWGRKEWGDGGGWGEEIQHRWTEICISLGVDVGRCDGGLPADRLAGGRASSAFSTHTLHNGHHRFCFSVQAFECPLLSWLMLNDSDDDDTWIDWDIVRAICYCYCYAAPSHPLASLGMHTKTGICWLLLESTDTNATVMGCGGEGTGSEVCIIKISSSDLFRCGMAVLLLGYCPTTAVWGMGALAATVESADVAWALPRRPRRVALPMLSSNVGALLPPRARSRCPARPS